MNSNEIKDLEEKYFDIRSKKENLEKELSKLNKDLSRTKSKSQHYENVLSVRSTIKDDNSKFLLICIIPPLTLAFSFILSHFITKELPGSIILSLVATYFISRSAIEYLYFPSVIIIKQRLRETNDSKATFELRETYLKSELKSINIEHDKLQALYIKNKDYLSTTLNALFNTPWKSLRGMPFEQFLKQIFDTHGHTAELTKISGDKGVDLIVNLKGKKMAVQAKGYDGAVGLEAVQQVYSGKAFYDCDLCCVITNSTFTNSAVDLADKLGCKLIDHDRMKEFIFECKI